MRVIVVAALCSVLSACAGATVYTMPVHTAMRAPPDRALVLTAMTAHDTPPIIMHGRYGSFPMTSGFTQDRVAAIDREVRAELVESHVPIEDERDLGGRPPGPGVYLLRLDVTAYRDDVSFAFADIIGCAMAGGLTLGLGALPCTTTRNSATQTLVVDARLYAATGARTASVPVNGHLESSIDVTDRRPVWHGTFRVRLDVGYSVFGMSNGAFADEEDTRLGQLIFAQLAPALVQGLAAPVPPDAYGPPPPAVPPPPVEPPAPINAASTS
jgi:hypothetical protein